MFSFIIMIILKPFCISSPIYIIFIKIFSNC